MRVLHIINHLQIGGAEILITNIAPLMQQKGIETTVFVLQETGSILEKRLTDKGVPLIFSSYKPVYSVFHLANLRNHLTKEQYDIIHVHLFPAQLWTVKALGNYKANTVLLTTEHNTLNRRRRKAFRQIDRWMYSRYQAIACVSEATGASLVEWIPELERKARVITNGVNIEELFNAVAIPKSEIIGQDDAPVVLFAGRFDAQKDHKTLLLAMANIPDAHLVLAGDGLTRPAVEELARKLGIANRTHFLGNRPDVPQLIKMADVYVQASHWEGFSLAAVEAMAGGLPVIASRVPGLMDVVSTAGLTFEAGNVDELSRHIALLINNPELRKEIAAKCQERAGNFSLDSTAEKYIELYTSLISKETTKP